MSRGFVINDYFIQFFSIAKLRIISRNKKSGRSVIAVFLAKASLKKEAMLSFAPLAIQNKKTAVKKN